MQSVDLGLMVKVNEDVKKVMRIAAEVNLSAINAMLVAKRSGEKTRGFAVVSSELRVFSRKLEVAMNSLGEMIFALVSDTAAMQKLNREYRHWHNTAQQSEATAQWIPRLLMRKQGVMQQMNATIGRNWGQLVLQLARALKLCEIGGALSRSAKIEAVYGGEMSATLKQVADEIEETVGEIFSTLRVLHARLAA